MKIITITLFFLVMTFFISGCGNPQSENKIEQLSVLVDEEKKLVTPNRPAEINGVILSVDGNKLIIKNEIGKEILSKEEQAERSAERKAMTREERQALRTVEKESVDTEDLTLVIPVGTLVLKGLGSEGGGDEGGNVQKVEFSELKKGAYISIWKNGDNIEAVKIKGL